MADEVGPQQPNLHLEPKWLRVRARTTELRSQHACRNAQKPMTPDSADANGQEAESALTLHNDGTAARDWCSPDNAHKLGLARGCISAILIIIRQPAKPDALHQCNSNIFKCCSLRLKQRRRFKNAQGRYPTCAVRPRVSSAMRFEQRPRANTAQEDTKERAKPPDGDTKRSQIQHKNL